jgi:hypothetical protein
MVTHRVPVEDFATLYDKFDRRVGGVQKVFVETCVPRPVRRPAPSSRRTSSFHLG